MSFLVEGAGHPDGQETGTTVCQDQLNTQPADVDDLRGSFEIGIALAMPGVKTGPHST